MTEPRSKVAQFLSASSRKCGKSAVDIAQEAGYGKPNIISMLRTGVTKLPLDRVPAMAKALNADPVTLMRLCMEEYMPEVYEILQDMKMWLFRKSCG